MSDTTMLTLGVWFVGMILCFMGLGLNGIARAIRERTK